MSRRTCLAACFPVALTIAGCATNHARYVIKEGDQGVVAIATDSPKLHRDAEKLMVQHFPKGYVIDSEKEEEIGTREDKQEESINGDKPMLRIPVGIPDAAVKKSSTQTFKIMEYRIKYHRKGAVIPHPRDEHPQAMTKPHPRDEHARTPKDPVTPES